jgi:hypothetical protein
MASESGTTDIEPLHFGGTKPPRRFWRNDMEDKGDFVHGAALLRSSVNSCHFGKTKHP